MKKPRIINIFIDAVTILFILIFTHTAYNKIYDHELLTQSLSKYPVIGSFPVFFTWAIPVVEIITVLLLLLPKYRILGLKISILLMTIFTGYILSLFTLDQRLPCTCGGMIETLTWNQHLLFNLSTLALGILSLIVQTRKKNLSHQTI